MDPTRVGRYRIVRRLGRSMTDVYLAIDTVENRQAALKLIKAGGDGTSRLIMEAERRGAAIQREMQVLDPRVVQIYDFGDQDGYFFVAMQYVEGRNLAEVLRRDHVLDTNRAAVIALEICEQLHKFHSWQSTVVHGDIKPSNILLGPSDTVRLLDFGIAKMLRADGSATAHQFGSPGYCSPERLTLSEVDRQSDLWAVGATLYEMLSGSPPYQAGSTRKLESLIRSKRPPRALPGSCPRRLQLIAMKALAPHPGKRYSSAALLQADLQAFLEGKPTLAERERHWNANATIEVAREVLRRATRTVKQAKQRWRLAGAAGWFLVGMAAWIGGTLGWQRLQARDTSKAHTTAAPQRAVPYSAGDARRHLALAQVYVYWLPNVERAMAEFHEAEQLGAAMGRPEIEQQGDAYRLQALREVANAPQTAWQDAQMARQIYERVRGFDTVEQSLQELQSVKPPEPLHRTRAKRATRLRPLYRRRTWR